MLALDVSSEAIARARAAHSDLKQVEFRVGNIMDYNLREEQPWDLIVMSETVYFLGWLYSFFDVSWFATEMFVGDSARAVRCSWPTHNSKPANLLRPWYHSDLP